MTKFLSIFFSFFISTLVFAQPWKDYLNFTFSTQKIDDQTAALVVEVKIADQWHVFSKYHDPNKSDFIGMPTTLTLVKNTGFKALGAFAESPKAKEHKDEFGVHQIFEKKVTFTQKISLLDKEVKNGKFILEGQVCHDEKGCIPFDKEFEFSLSGYLTESNVATEIDTTDHIVEDTAIDTIEEPVVENETKNETIDIVQEPAVEDSSMLLTFVLGFGGGLIALLTPCVFPMIPMTVSFFTKQSGSRKKAIGNALIYGISIVVIYVTIGLLITGLLGKTGLNDLSTNIWMNLVFFAIFVLFAFSFLGAFEIRLPSKWINNADKNADKGGLIGIFFMAFTLGLVSFSCTGPIIGTLIVESSQNGLFGPAIGMLGFAIALALPFTLFAIFPGWLNSMPQSGGWLNSVKVVLGLAELALSLKFLSGVDLAYHWGILTREIFLALWIVIFAIMGFYLLGKIRFSHDSPVEHLSVTRFMFAVVTLTFTVYLIPGMFGAPLNLIDGIAPARSHSEDHFKFVTGYGNSNATATIDDSLTAYYSQMHEVDGGIKVFHDLELGKEFAKKVNKPILLDFTGYNCANCRRTESTVWTNDKVRPILSNDFVIVSLYVDDKTALPKEEQTYSKILDSKKRFVGHKWSEFQIERYKQVSQPLHVVLDVEGNDLTKAIGYTPNIDSYQAFLKEGLQNFKK